MKSNYKEIEHQLSESRREFLAADATINNLELKLADMAAQLANAENKCMEIAAENEAIKFYLRNGPVVRKGDELVAAHQFSPETPASDAFLAEVRAHDLNAFIRHHSAELDAHIKNGGEQFDEKSVRIRDIIVSARLFREQIRQNANSTMLQRSEPETDNTNQQFESLSRGDK